MVLLRKCSELERKALHIKSGRSIDALCDMPAHQKPCEVIRWHHKTVLAIIGALSNKCDSRESRR
jgi:hypothetical protein